MYLIDDRNATLSVQIQQVGYRLRATSIPKISVKATDTYNVAAYWTASPETSFKYILMRPLP